MTAECFAVMADVVSAAPSAGELSEGGGSQGLAQPAFVPRVAPQDVAGADVPELGGIRQGMTRDDGVATENAVEKMWTEYRSSLSPSIQALLPSAPTEAFWHENYYAVAAEIVADRAMAESAAARARFTPRVPPADAVAANVQECEEIARSMTEEDGAAVEVAVEKMWHDYASAFPGSIRSLLPPAPAQEFWEEKYCEVAAQIMGSRASALASALEARARPPTLPMGRRTIRTRQFASCCSPLSRLSGERVGRATRLSACAPRARRDKALWCTVPRGPILVSLRQFFFILTCGLLDTCFMPISQAASPCSLFLWRE
ncbi:unnamed protein product [Prorocentrum cordatum]|nr:unnamed protein product [Polarella glacialis]